MAIETNELAYSHDTGQAKADSGMDLVEVGVQAASSGEKVS